MLNLLLLILYLLWILIQYKLLPKIYLPKHLRINDCCSKDRKKLCEKDKR